MGERNLSIEGWHSVEEWARRTGRCKRTIRNWTRAGLRYSKIGCTVLVNTDDMLTWIDAHARGGNMPPKGKRG
jgi:hypothetical protein